MMSLENKLLQITRLQGELLREHKLGHPDWYAEMLVCAHTGGQLALTNNPKYDIETTDYGKIQVKCRVNGTDTTQNRTNFGKYKQGDFEYAAIIIFQSDYTIYGASLIPQIDVLSLVRPAGHVKWIDVENHKNSICIKKQLKSISCE
tara:strand:- start:530 stop:970 length:441 start_codon:yes stop_codon:yes gene_type:complete